MLRMVSLFAGIGGFDLAAEAAGGIEIVGQVEIADYPTRVLERHWPDVPRIRDIHDYHGHEFGRVDLLTGGYPCQPFSLAGRRDGEADPRHLWPQVLRAIRVLRPNYSLLENVPGHLSRGFGTVLGDLAEIGHGAEWDCVPARSVGAPHSGYGRERIWIVAYPDSGGRDGAGVPRQTLGETLSGSTWGGGVESRLPDPASGYWEVEPDVGRVVDGVSPGMDRAERKERLIALGNAIVPQVATPILQRIVAAHPRQPSMSEGSE